MKNTFLIFSLFSLIFFSCSVNNEVKILSVKTQSFTANINDKGLFINLIDTKTGREYLQLDTISPILTIRSNNKFLIPKSATVTGSNLVLEFDNNIVANILIEEKNSHFTFELTSITNNEIIDLIIWGPYYTSISGRISETVGVVSDDDYSIGIQALNIKTLGGYPWNESDRMPAFDIIREQDVNNMHPKADGSVLYRVEAAKPTENGSSLQAYCRNRDRERIYQDFNHKKIIAPPYDDGGIIGSKIALFGVSSDNALETIGKIEIAEGLPHPMIDGQWVKTNRDASAAYLITSFTEETVDDAIELTKKAGLKYLYHYGKTFENWGHFALYKGEFPNGIDGLRYCVERAEAKGIKIGTHCLSNFITTNDPYVTPIPDQRLAKVGSSVLTSDIDVSSTEIPIRSPEYFNQMKNNNLKTVMIGNELIRYGSVSEESPWQLLDCQRGAFNTEVSEHLKGTEISKLLDHGYKVFLTNADLTIEMSEKLADIYNKTGMRQISFDGLEGNRSTGLGTYGESLMPYTWYNSLSEELKKHLIVDASRTTHFFWHIYSRMNWGEPWYAGFRESQTEYRFNNQAYFKRNFMPGMLGWFKLTPETSIEDIEWMLARSAGYDAGYALVAGTESVEKNGNIESILQLIGDWEKLRISNSFNVRQKELMRDNSREFSIARIKENQWNWQEINSNIFTHKKQVKQPGEPLYSSFTFNNPGDRQTMEFSITAINCDVSNIILEVNNYKKIQLPISLTDGQILKFTGDNKVAIYDPDWNLVHKIAIDSSLLEIVSGENLITFDCDFDNYHKDSNVKLEFRANVTNEIVSLSP